MVGLKYIHMFLDGEPAWIQRYAKNSLVGDNCGPKTTDRVGEQLCDNGCNTDGREPEEEKLVET